MKSGCKVLLEVELMKSIYPPDTQSEMPWFFLCFRYEHELSNLTRAKLSVRPATQSSLLFRKKILQLCVGATKKDHNSNLKVKNACWF